MSGQEERSQTGRNTRDIRDSFEYDFIVNTREIIMCGEINDLFYTKLLKNLCFLRSVNSDPITIYLSSCGGYVQEGIGLFDFIKSMDCYVSICCLGQCMSMASFILQAADERLMSRSSTLMLHEISHDIAATSSNIAVALKNSEDTYKIMLDEYSNRSKLDHNTLRNNMKVDWYLTAEEALKFGLIDRIYG